MPSSQSKVSRTTSTTHPQPAPLASYPASDGDIETRSTRTNQGNLRHNVDNPLLPRPGMVPSDFLRSAGTPFHNASTIPTLSPIHLLLGALNPPSAPYRIATSARSRSTATRCPCAIAHSAAHISALERRISSPAPLADTPWSPAISALQYRTNSYRSCSLPTPASARWE